MPPAPELGKVPEGSCWSYWEGKKCRLKEEGKECKFNHIRSPTLKLQCDKCGSNSHLWSDCTYTSKCEYCGKKGHKATLCKSRKKDERRKSPRPKSQERGKSPKPAPKPAIKPAKKVSMAVAELEDGSESRGEFQG